MEIIENTEIKSIEITDKEIDQIIGGIEDVPPNQLFVDGTKIDLYNPDYLSDKIEK